MCRWLAYSGSVIPIDHVLLKPKPSLIDQSLHSEMGATTTNGDGFGMGWYEQPDDPHVFHSSHPAWNDRNLREIAASISAPIFLAHVRASTGGAIQQSNTHPFRHGRWLWMHNGLIREFSTVSRELRFAVAEELFPFIEGTTDSETMFFLALTFGLEEDPPGAVERMVGFVEATGRKHGIEHPIQMTIATSDGRSLWAFRYSSEGQSRSLFVSTAVDHLRALHPELKALEELSNESRIVVSEPLGHVTGAWNAFPESSWGVVHEGPDEVRPFTPRMP